MGTLGEDWRKMLANELTNPMKPVPARIALLKGLDYLVEELNRMNLVEFDQLYRREKVNHPYRL